MLKLFVWNRTSFILFVSPVLLGLMAGAALEFSDLRISLFLMATGFVMGMGWLVLAVRRAFSEVP